MGTIEIIAAVIYEVLFELANELIRSGGTVRQICKVMRGHKILPAGTTSNEQIPLCSSIVDYVARYLENKR